MAKDDKDSKTEPKDLNGLIYEEYVNGASPAALAEAHSLDSSEVLAIIQEVQASKIKA